MTMDRRTNAGRAWTEGQHSFAQIPGADIPRSVFDRSSGLRTAFDAGYLIPIRCDEALPGDTISMEVSSFVRMSTPLVPLMDNLWMDIFWFSVPCRLVWDNWQKFMGEQRNPGDSTSFLVPQFTAYTPSNGLLSDFMGIPPNGVNVVHNSLHHRAYNFIYNEWFRDENLQNSVVVDLDDGPDAIADYVLLRRGKRHDYFTSALPFPQKGNPVLLPLGTSAPLSATTAPLTITSTATPTFTFGGATNRSLETDGSANDLVQMSGAALGTVQTMTWNTPGLGGTASLVGITADLAAATAATINQIRQAFQIQRLLERDARGGSRYTEILRAHFGVISPDGRMQRPEYLGGGSVRVSINPVARTTQSGVSGAGPALAELGAFGLAADIGQGFTKSFTEHCLIIGLVNVRADLVYQQGLERMWSRQTRYDYYWPALAHTGEQEIKNKEIYYQNTAADELTFGYQERYAEYRYAPSRTSSRMRSQYFAPIDQWHLGQEFSALPVLNASFIVDNPPMARVLAVTPDQNSFFGDFWFRWRHARPMPTFGVPGLVDHF